MVERSQRTLGERTKALSEELEESGAKIDALTSKAQQTITQRANLLKTGVKESGEAAERATTEAQARLETQLSDIRGQIEQTSDIVDTATEKLTVTVDKILQASSEASEQLEGAVLDLEARLAEFPDHAKETTFSIRKVVEDQISVFTEITDEAAEKARTLDAALQAKLKFNREALRGLLSYLDLDGGNAAPLPKGEPTPALAPSDTAPRPTEKAELDGPKAPLQIEAPSADQEHDEGWRQRPDLQPNAEASDQKAEDADISETPDAPADEPPMPAKPRVNFLPPGAEAGPDPSPDAEIGAAEQPAPSAQEEMDDLAERLTARLQKAKGLEPKETAAPNTVEDPPPAAQDASADDDGVPPRQFGLADAAQADEQAPEIEQEPEAASAPADETSSSDESTLKSESAGEPLAPASGQPSMASKRGWKWRDILAAADSEPTEPSKSIPLQGSTTDNVPRTSLHMIETLQAMTVDLGPCPRRRPTCGTRATVFERRTKPLCASARSKQTR